MTFPGHCRNVGSGSKPGVYPAPLQFSELPPYVVWRAACPTKAALNQQAQFGESAAA